MRIFTQLIFILFSLKAGATGHYLINAQIKSNSSFQTQLRAKPHLKRFSELSLQMQRKLADDQNIESLFLRTKDRLSINDPESIQLLEKIYSLRFQFEWSELQRESIKKSLLMLSALERDPLRQDKLKIEASEFEPKQNKSGPKLRQILPDEITQNYSFLSINGKVFGFDDRLDLPQGEFRLGLYSDNLQSWFKVLHVSDLKRLKADMRPLVSGSCETGFYLRHLDVNAEAAKVSVVDDKCLVDANIRPALSQTGHIMQNFSTPDKVKKDRDWVWIAAGVIGGFIAYQNLKTKDNDSSTREGF